MWEGEEWVPTIGVPIRIGKNVANFCKVGYHFISFHPCNKYVYEDERHIRTNNVAGERKHYLCYQTFWTFARRGRLGARHIGVSDGIRPKDEVWIRVANDGAPIPVSNQEQIFVPFFTTKAEGSGIGLSLSRQIMRAHGGSLSLVKSDVNETVFELLFR